MTDADRVLIVEDEVMLALELEAELQSMGITVCGMAPNIKDAVTLTIKEKPNLVMMDVHLDGPQDGVEIARWLSEMYGLPVIFLTAYADNRMLLERIHQLIPGAPVLSKPLDRSRLSEAIADLRNRPPPLGFISMARR
jgi:response regulator of citrate/malate metabolism